MQVGVAIFRSALARLVTFHTMIKPQAFNKLGVDRTTQHPDMLEFDQSQST
jgi:hypothetical protein